jgi:hypothetical protein
LLLSHLLQHFGQTQTSARKNPPRPASASSRLGCPIPILRPPQPTTIPLSLPKETLPGTSLPSTKSSSVSLAASTRTNIPSNSTAMPLASGSASSRPAASPPRS